MGKISEVQCNNGLYYVTVERRNGSTYRVTSPDKKGIEEYRSEFLQAMKARLAKGR